VVEQKKQPLTSEVSRPLRELLEEIATKCTGCGKCTRTCAFLSERGKPGKIASTFDLKAPGAFRMAFDCSLCELCKAVCPEEIDPSALFLEMRREAVRRGEGTFPEHKVIRAYESRGQSKTFSLYAIPEGCDTIFFPGCNLPGSRPERVIQVIEHLQGSIPRLGVVLDCCAKPSHDLGDQARFEAHFFRLREFLLEKGVRTVIVACPNCHKVFARYGNDLSVRTVYEVFDEIGPPERWVATGSVTIHDPCAVRWETAIHGAVRNLVARSGLTVDEMRAQGKKTFCCGEGGSVGFIRPEFSREWTNKRMKDAAGRTLVTYCAGCAGFLSRSAPTHHLLDLLFEPEATLGHRVRPARTPITYFNRLRLKNRLKRSFARARIWEGPLEAETEKKKVLVPRFLLLVLIVASAFGVRYSGAMEYLAQDNLRQVISNAGPVAPLLFVGLYSLAPVLFLPGLPFAVVAGILFGPILGVLYAITGATIGATVAFFVGRTIGRSWIEEKITDPRLRRLDEAVERHGWKVVAFTRLIPLFPFNLLNYAFGLTRIRAIPYIAASFIFMLPACVAYVVFASSLADVLAGRISAPFVWGLVSIVIVGLIPVLYRRLREKKGVSGII